MLEPICRLNQDLSRACLAAWPFCSTRTLAGTKRARSIGAKVAASSSAPQELFHYCPVLECRRRFDGFTRRDSFERHMAAAHPEIKTGWDALHAGTASFGQTHKERVLPAKICHLGQIYSSQSLTRVSLPEGLQRTHRTRSNRSSIVSASLPLLRDEESPTMHNTKTPANQMTQCHLAKPSTR